MDVRRKELLFLGLGLLPSLIVAASAWLFIPIAIATYERVAAQLPSQTRFVFSFYYLCALLPALVVCVWFTWRNPRRRGLAAAAFGILGSVAVFAFGWWAVYQPELILQLIKYGSR